MRGILQEINLNRNSKTMKHIYFTIFSTVFSALFFTMCSPVEPTNFEVAKAPIAIYPDYTNLTIPYNICPLNFEVEDPFVCKTFLKIYGTGEDTIKIKGDKSLIIPIKDWRNLLLENKGSKIYLQVFSKNSNTKKWTKHPVFFHEVAKEPIDPYLAYRLILGSYEILGECHLMQRNLENFDESAMVTNDLNVGTCLNCHTFYNRQPDKLMFHVRFKDVGTVIYDKGTLSKSQTETKELKVNGIYPSWHPNGKYIAFSVNAVFPTVYTHFSKYMEAYDTISDLAIYDVKTNTMITTPKLKTEEYNETHPHWSPDGKYLYYARTKKISFGNTRNPVFNDSLKMTPPQHLEKVHYDLLRIPFDAEKFEKIISGEIPGSDTSSAFGEAFGEVEVILSYEETGKSISLPRISPDGKYLIFCMHSQGTFASWHRDSDLYIMDLNTGKYRAMEEVNGPDADSYHTWSGNSRWISFASKRIDGFYTRLYFSYVDAEGRGRKPFILPQKRPRYYDDLMKIYNLPEFIEGKVEASPYDFSEQISKPAQQANYRYIGGVDSIAIKNAASDAKSGATGTFQ